LAGGSVDDEVVPDHGEDRGRGEEGGAEGEVSPARECLHKGDTGVRQISGWLGVMALIGCSDSGQVFPTGIAPHNGVLDGDALRLRIATLVRPGVYLYARVPE
jgi:hypothetical protein